MSEVHVPLPKMDDVPETLFVADELAMKRLAGELIALLHVGDMVLLFGDLGAGKTTFVRGVLEALKWDGIVRSPTFNLMQLFDTKPPIVHADLYRLSGEDDFGLEEAGRDRITFVEWPERFASLLSRTDCWRIKIEILKDGRNVCILLPGELVP